MKRHSDKDTKKFLKGIWEGGDDSWNKLDITINTNSIDEVNFEVGCMYEYVTLNLKILKQLSAFFETDNIDDSRYSSGGCETCDYGSSYKIFLTIKPDE